MTTLHVVIWIGIAFWATALTIHDLRTRRIPNSRVYPLLVVAVIVAILFPLKGPLAREQGLLVVIGLTASAFAWITRLLGGADIKLAVAFILLLPYPEFYAALLVIGIVGSIIVLAAWDRGKGLKRLGALLFTTFTTRRLPSVAELRDRSQGVAARPPAAWMVSVPAIVTITTALLQHGLNHR